MPEVDVEIGNGLASGNINELNVHVECDTLLIFTDIGANIFALHICVLPLVYQPGESRKAYVQ